MPVLLLSLVLHAAACGAPRLTVFPDRSDPLKEFTLQGEGRQKVLLVHIEGSVSDRPRGGLFGRRESLVQAVVSRLRKARTDRDVKALVLKIDSPGGTVGASDMLYHEISSWREQTGVPVVALFMKTATSGAYYLALPADFIMAHPTTVTGSAGVIFLRPKVAGLIEKLGVGVEVSKSGRLKDLGSPFREDTEEEEKILQEMIDRLGARFLDLVSQHRGIEGERLAEVATARVFLPEDALRLGLVDGTGYVDDAFARARELAGLPEDARVVVYGRGRRPDDTPYGRGPFSEASGDLTLVDLPFPVSLPELEAGFHYLWLPGLGTR